MVKVNLNNLKKTLITDSKKESPNGYTLEWVISERGWERDIFRFMQMIII